MCAYVLVCLSEWPVPTFLHNKSPNCIELLPQWAGFRRNQLEHRVILSALCWPDLRPDLCSTAERLQNIGHSFWLESNSAVRINESRYSKWLYVLSMLEAVFLNYADSRGRAFILPTLFFTAVSFKCLFWIHLVILFTPKSVEQRDAYGFISALSESIHTRRPLRYGLCMHVFCFFGCVPEHDQLLHFVKCIYLLCLLPTSCFRTYHLLCMLNIACLSWDPRWLFGKSVSCCTSQWLTVILRSF